MPQIQAICQNPSCRTSFPSGFSMGGNCSATMIGNMAGPCPRCGSMGIIPDGKYETIKDRLTVILNNVKKVEDLEHLKRVLENSIKKNKPKNAKKKLLKKSPEHAEVWRVLPKDGVDLFLILGMILQMISIIIALYSSQNKSGDTTFVWLLAVSCG